MTLCENAFLKKGSNEPLGHRFKCDIPGSDVSTKRYTGLGMGQGGEASGSAPCSLSQTEKRHDGN